MPLNNPDENQQMSKTQQDEPQQEIEKQPVSQPKIQPNPQTDSEIKEKTSNIESVKNDSLNEIGSYEGNNINPKMVYVGNHNQPSSNDENFKLHADVDKDEDILNDEGLESVENI